MHKRIYLENEIKAPFGKDISDQENFNTLNLSNATTVGKVSRQELQPIQPKQLKIIQEPRRLENGSAKFLPNPKNVFLNLKSNFQADNFSSNEKIETLDFFTKNSCLTLGEEDKDERFVKDTLGSQKVSKFVYNSSRRKRGFFNIDTEELEISSESEDTSENFSCSTSVNITQLDVKENDGDTLKNPKLYGLKTSLEDDLISPGKITHKYLPYSLKDDEKYKRSLFSFLRKPGYSDHKTDTRKVKSRKFTEVFGTTFLILDGNLTKYFSLYDMKRRKVNSQKKVFESDRYFLSDVNRYVGPQAFKIYYDKDIGFSKRWQGQLKETVRLFITIGNG
jgi:hypothetical protein